MANYSDKDLHWITVHPNGKEEKPGVKIAINGAGKVVKGPKGLKDDINAEGGLPGAKSLPLDELKKQKGNGGAGAAGAGENGFSGLTDALGGLLDDGDGGGEVGVTSPNDAASSLLNDEAGTASGGEKPSGAKMCENAQKFFASFKSFHQQYLDQAGTQEILEEAVASALTDDDFKAVNGKMLIKSESLGKLSDAIEAAKKGKGSAAAGGGDNPTEAKLCESAKKWMVESPNVDLYIKDAGSQEALEKALSALSEDDFSMYNGNVFLKPDSLDKLEDAVKAVKKGGGTSPSGEPPLCPKAKKWLASGTAMEEVWTSKFGSEEAFKEALSKLDDEDFLASLFDITLTPDGVKKLDAMAKGNAQTEAGENAAPPLCEFGKQFLADKGKTYRKCIKDIQEKFGVSESEAETKLAGYLAEIGEWGIYNAEHDEGVGGWKEGLTKKGKAAIEAAIDKDAASAGGSAGGGAELCDKAKKWFGMDSLIEYKLLQEIKSEFAAHGVNLTDVEAEAKLKEYASSLKDEDFAGEDHLYLTEHGVGKMMAALKKAVAEAKAGGGGNGAEPTLNQMAENWLDYGDTGFYLDNLTKAGLTEEEAIEKLKEIAATLNADDFDSKGKLSTSGANKLIEASNKVAQENAAKANGAADPSLAPADQSAAASGQTLSESWVKSDQAKEHYVPEITDALGLEGDAAEAKLAELASQLGGEDFNGDGSITWSGGKKIMDAIEKEKAEKAASAEKMKELVKKNKLCKKAAEWLMGDAVSDGGAVLGKEYFVAVAKDQFGVGDAEAEEMVAQALSKLNGKNFTPQGGLTTLGYKKMKIALAAMHPQGGAEGGAQAGQQTNLSPDAQTAAQTAAPIAPAAQAAKPLPPPKPAKPVSPELTAGNVPFPKDEKALSGLTMVKPLGGASGAHATLYKDASGNMFVMKKYAATDKAGQARLKEECDADAFYLSGGANVPHFRLYGDEKSGYTKLSQYIPGTKTLGETWKTADAATKEKIKQNLRKDFALDVMAGAWDVLGTGRDNILVDGEGNVWRCDNGGAFNRRAQGGEKDEAAWGNGHIDDLWTMRGMSASLDGKKIPDGTGKAEFFGDITTHQLLSDIVTRDWDKMTAHLPEATRQVMAKRIANAKEYHAVCDNVVVDGMYGDGQHSEDITLNYHCLNKFGARAGCVNKNVGPHNWGWCRGNGNGHPAPKLEDFTNAPEPTLEQFLPSANKKDAEQKLLAAGKTINHHLFDEKDGSVNKASVEAALALKPSLETVANEGGKDAAKAKEMLAFLDEVQKVKDGGYKMLDHKFGFAPSGEVDLNSAAAKAEAQAKFEEAHKAWQETTKNAQAKYAAAKKKWEKENGGSAFKWKNLTDCFEDFCKQNGIDSSLFWGMAKDQGGEAYYKGSCQMKAIELREMGFTWDAIKKDECEGAHLAHVPNTFSSAEEFEKSPKLYAAHRRAYIAMKSLTQMLLHNSDFDLKIDAGHLFAIRSEHKENVVGAYDIVQDGMNIYPMGTHESFAVDHLVHVHGTEDIGFAIPFSRISSLYWLLNPQGNPMFCDSEGEAGINAIGLAGYYFSKAKYKVVDNMKKFLSVAKQKAKKCVPKAK